MEYFASNMTPFIQLCDVEIICCFKAHYHHHFNQHAINCDKVGEQETYKIDLLDGNGK